jgi:DNA-binding response OmpR family regulator
MSAPRGWRASMRVLVIEDYAPLSRSLCLGLREAGYAVDAALDGEDGLAHVESAVYDAIILDLMLPKVDGLTILERVRSRRNPTAVVVLTARDRVADRVKGLDLGADDYLVKPFAFEELLARMRAVIRRQYGSPAGVRRIADLEIDTAARSVKRGNQTIVLSAREYALLEYLAARQGQTVSRAEIWEHLYDFASEPSSNVVDVYIGYLRRKIDRGFEPALIHTRRGLGYVLGEAP